MPVSGQGQFEPVRGGYWRDPALGADAPWLAVMAAVTALEFLWWGACFLAGVAPAPFLAPYLAAASTGLALAVGIRWMIWRRAPGAAWPASVGGTLLLAIGASLFLPLKFAIPKEIGFWLDQPLAAAERALFGLDPWLLLDRLLGWTTIPIDRLYGLWLPVQLAAFFAVLVGPPSLAKSRALIAYAMAWFVLGVVAAVLLSSAGPIFYDRLLGGDRFAELGPLLHYRGAVMALTESDAMWASYSSGHAALVAGISAAPSLHVAISLWIYLAARRLAPRAAPAALGYTLLMWVASVQLGWHYVSDGAIGVVGMLGLWAVAGWLGGRLSGQPNQGSGP